MTSDKKSAALVAEIFVRRGLEHIVISPGSRNAPLIIAFAGNLSVKALSIFDERSAAFFALGLARQTRKTVAIACTSGTAALNYAPAIAEAYYQKVPLLVLTADRPKNQIDKGDGQTIRQQNVYQNFIKKSYEIAEEFTGEEETMHTANLINSAISLTMHPDGGPVHINLPFSEPLYNISDNLHWKTGEPVEETAKSLPEISDIEKLLTIWNSAGKKLLIAGMMDPNPLLEATLKKITADPSVVLLTETTSNLRSCAGCHCIDKAVHTIKPDEGLQFAPDLLITFGGHIVSKMVKSFLQKNKPAEHWHIDLQDTEMDAFQCLTRGIRATPFDFFSALLPGIVSGDTRYSQLWYNRARRSEERHATFLKSCPFSDLKVFERVLQCLPDHSILHLGNSTPVRYAQLFRTEKNLVHISNRGVSGIDGTVSTAVGAAWASGNILTLITGDLGFLYDSNGLFNKYLSKKLRIIVINNSGGGIFRFIPGPDSTPYLEDFFEARHSYKARYLAQAANIAYFHASNEKELAGALNEIYRDDFPEPALLEVFTPPETSGETLRDYFKYLSD